VVKFSQKPTVESSVDNVYNQQFLDVALGHIQATFDGALAFVTVDVDRRRLESLRRHVLPGKMLRTRLGLALCPQGSGDQDAVARACAATELIHTATLYHDDVIDGASLRRQQPTLWQEVGQTGAILLGDLFFSSAIELLLDGADLNQARLFVARVKEVCATETIHEMVFQGRTVDAETCIAIARGKTGALFAFVAECCGKDATMAKAMAEAGYCVGTAYQLADDLLDEVGVEQLAGKTLGTDRKRRKFTLAQQIGSSDNAVLAEISRLCGSAIELLRPWPVYADRLDSYITTHLAPAWEMHLQSTGGDRFSVDSAGC
jgi:geranylgeranyl pyrophosphate synthase